MTSSELFEKEVAQLLGNQYGRHDPGSEYPLIIRLRLILDCPWEGCLVTKEEQCKKAEAILQLNIIK